MHTRHGDDATPWRGGNNMKPQGREEEARRAEKITSLKPAK